MDQHNILPLVGLALRGGNLAVGEEPAGDAAQAKDARLLLLAADAPENTRRRAERFAQTGQCLLVRIPFSKAELGRAVGRSSAAVAAVTDLGLACALGRKLALLDPEQYGDLSRRLELKARRARERRTERETRAKEQRSQQKRRSGPGPQAAGKISPGRDRGSPEPPPGRRDGPRPDRPAHQSRGAPAEGRPPRRKAGGGSPGGGRTKPNPYARSRPVKKGKGSFRKRED